MINNSGSYFLIQIALVAFMLFKFCLNQLAKLMYKSHYARLVGQFAYEDHYLINLSRDSIKLFMESYFDLVFCAMINIWALTHFQNSADLQSFFETPLDVLASTLTIIYSILLLIYPVFGYIGVWKNQGRLNTRKVQKQLQPLLEGIKLNEFHSSMFNVYFLWRRLFSGIILVAFNETPYF